MLLFGVVAVNEEVVIVIENKMGFTFSAYTSCSLACEVLD